MSEQSSKSKAEEDINEYLESDVNQIVDGNILGVKGQVEDTKKKINKLQKMHNTIKEKIRHTTDKILSYKHNDYDTDEAETLVEEAKAAFNQMEYKKAKNILDDTENALENALYKPFPLLTRKVKLITVFKEADMNNDDKKDDDNEEMKKSIKCIFKFVNEEEKKSGELMYTISSLPGIENVSNIHLGEVEGNSEKSITFNLGVEDEGEIEEGSLPDLIIDGDIAVKSKLDLSDQSPSHQVKIKNTSDHHLQNLRVKPLIPSVFETEFDYRDIDLIRKGRTKTIHFTLFLK